MRFQQVTPSLWRFRPNTGSGTSLAIGHSRTFLLFPFAGGSAHSLAEWLPLLVRNGDTAYLVQYPGRGSRAGEPTAASLARLADEIVGDLRNHAEGPFVLIGHSMGAVLGYESAVRLEAAGQTRLLVVSACRPPHLIDLEAERLYRLRGKDWIARMAADGFVGVDDMPDEMLNAAISTLRSDCILVAEHFAHGGMLKCRVLAIGGESDLNVPAEHLRAWAALTTGPVTMRVLPGGHFYYRDRLSEVCELIHRELGQEEEARTNC
jgi:surfactin synthase thioesterase subunit